MNKKMLCRIATPFKQTGELDEQSLREILQRLVNANVGVYLGNPGSGEGHALTNRELGRIYEIGVDVCKGKVPVHANPPEQPTARDTREQMAIAATSGVDLINLYGPSGRHGYKPTEGELLAYFDDVLGNVEHSVAIAPDPAIGYPTKPEIIARVSEKYPQVRAINIGDFGEGYFLTLKDMLKRNIDLYVISPGALRTLGFGAAGILSAEANIIPQTCRKYVELYERGNAAEELNVVYLQISQFSQFVSKWGPANPRWIKMCMRLLKLPGGEGGVREPYLMPLAEEMQKFSAGILKLGIPEIDELARSAGLRVHP